MSNISSGGGRMISRLFNPFTSSQAAANKPTPQHPINGLSGSNAVDKFAVVKHDGILRPFLSVKDVKVSEKQSSIKTVEDLESAVKNAVLALQEKNVSQRIVSRNYDVLKGLLGDKFDADSTHKISIKVDNNRIKVSVGDTKYVCRLVMRNGETLREEGVVGAKQGFNRTGTLKMGTTTPDEIHPFETHTRVGVDAKELDSKYFENRQGNVDLRGCLKVTTLPKTIFSMPSSSLIDLRDTGIPHDELRKIHHNQQQAGYAGPKFIMPHFITFDGDLTKLFPTETPQTAVLTAPDPVRNSNNQSVTNILGRVEAAIKEFNQANPGKLKETPDSELLKQWLIAQNPDGTQAVKIEVTPLRTTISVGKNTYACQLMPRGVLKVREEGQLGRANHVEYGRFTRYPRESARPNVDAGKFIYGDEQTIGGGWASTLDSDQVCLDQYKLKGPGEQRFALDIQQDIGTLNPTFRKMYFDRDDSGRIVHSLPNGFYPQGGIHIGGSAFALKSLPDWKEIFGSVELVNMRSLESVPSMTIGADFSLKDLPELRQLPEGSAVKGTAVFSRIPKATTVPTMTINGNLLLKKMEKLSRIDGAVSVDGHVRLDALPNFVEFGEGFAPKGDIKITNCPKLSRLPESIYNMPNTSQIDLRESKMSETALRIIKNRVNDSDYTGPTIYFPKEPGEVSDMVKLSY